MKRALLLLLTAWIILPVIAQNERQKTPPSPPVRCATQEAIERRYQTNPVFRAMMEERERDFQRWLANHRNNETPVTEALTGIVTIPVVVHVVLPNPALITDADVEYFINRLNLDFSGLNPDSTNGVTFYGVRGHSLLRFCLAKRDPAGNYTSGIERRTGAGTIGSGEPQAIKSFGAGGLNPWNTSLYYNIWVGTSGGLLGISPEIGPGTSASDGVCINYQSFANNPCYTIGAFNLARTAVHEIGHNFGLYHTFQGGCSNADMQQLTSPGCVLPGPVLSLTDDTPGQSASTSGCPSGNAATGCAGFPNPPGKQYQNYMDYTDDACYSMFTKTQVERMHWVTENCRAGYLTSNGCQLPAGTAALDAAALEVISPNGAEMVGCNLVSYPLAGCTGAFTPKLRIENRGSTTLTSVTVQMTLNGTPLAPQTFSVNIPYGKNAVVTLAAATAATGANTISFTVSNPNGGADGNAANNTITTNPTYTPIAGVNIPISADFVAATFPPTNFTVVNPNSNNTWVRNANGNGNAGSAFIDNYNFNLAGQTDDIRSVAVTLPPAIDSLILTFDLAHKNFPGFNDRLQVMVSSDCGVTFTTAGINPVFDRSGATLATAGSSTANYTSPAAADWKNQRLAIYVGPGSPFTPGGVLYIAFRATNAYGNNIFLDNINLSAKYDRDMQVTAILNPTGNLCSGTATPSVTVKNNGVQTINSYKVAYKIDNGTPVVSPVISTPLAPGATTNVTLAPFTTTAGAHTFTAYTQEPVSASGSGEQLPGNDTTSAPFTVLPLVANITENFTAVTFPPTNWSLANPNGNNTWVRNANGNGNAGSAFIDNYNFNLVGQTDELQTPPVNTTGASVLFIDFDLAHKNFPGFNDRLQVLYSTDCGATWLPTSFDRSGAALATAGSSTASYTTPAAGDWVRQSVGVNLCSAPAAQVRVAFRNTNAYGNNIFLDNISVTPGAPNVAQPANQTVCNNTATAAVTFTGTVTGTTFSWTNNTPSIGLAASGTGNIPSFTAVNAGSAPVVATITVTPALGACTGTAVTFTITVNPTPNAIATPASQTICTGTAITPIVLTSAVAGTTYTWSRDNTASITGIAANGIGNITGSMTNLTTAPVTVTFTIIPSANGCTGAPISATVTVNPLPTISCPANITVPSTLGLCTAPVTYTPTATGVPAPTYTYSTTGATTASGSGTGSGLLFNVGVTTVNLTATNTCGAASCSFTITVTDSQLPVITQQPVNNTVCAGSNATFSVTATNALSYQWQQWNGTAWVNIAGATASSYTVSSVTQSMNTNTFRVQVIGLCTTITSGAASLYVNPLPTVLVAAAPTQSLLPNQTTNINATATPAGGSYVWLFNGTAISGAGGPVLGPLGVDDIGTYSVRYTDLNGCVTTSATITITGQPGSRFWVYPNPNTGHFIVRYYNQNNESLTLNIYNGLGQRIMQKAYITTTPYSGMEVDMNSSFSNGMFIVELINSAGEKVGSQRVLIWH